MASLKGERMMRMEQVGALLWETPFHPPMPRLLQKVSVRSCLCIGLSGPKEVVSLTLARNLFSIDVHACAPTDLSLKIIQSPRYRRLWKFHFIIRLKP